MPLSKDQLSRLLVIVADTRDDEITCDECLAGMAEFADARLLGSTISTALKRIEAHIEFCPECKQEYELLLALLAAQAGDPVEES
ncbi:MAG: hypothetical protein WCE62_00140 [Polyangiales bacterium]